MKNSLHYTFFIKVLLFIVYNHINGCSVARKRERNLYYVFIYSWKGCPCLFLCLCVFVYFQPSAHGGVGGSYPPSDSWNQHRPEHTALWSPNIEVHTHTHTLSGKCHFLGHLWASVELAPSISISVLLSFSVIVPQK